MRLHLRREIVLVLAIKVLVLYCLWLTFFSEPQVPKMTEGMDPDRVAAALIASQTSTDSPTPDPMECHHGD